MNYTTQAATRAKTLASQLLGFPNGNYNLAEYQQMIAAAEHTTDLTTTISDLEARHMFPALFVFISMLHTCVSKDGLLIYISRVWGKL